MVLRDCGFPGAEGRARGAPSRSGTDGGGRTTTAGALVQHGGSLDGYQSTVDIYPDEDLAVVALLNKESAPLLELVRIVSDYYHERSGRGGS